MPSRTLDLPSGVLLGVNPIGTRRIIVSDGSTDGTDEIVERFLAKNQWIELVRMPERLWEEFYTGLMRKLKQKSAWCPIAADAVSWFQNRRSVVFLGEMTKE